MGMLDKANEMKNKAAGLADQARRNRRGRSSRGARRGV